MRKWEVIEENICNLPCTTSGAKSWQSITWSGWGSEKRETDLFARVLVYCISYCKLWERKATILNLPRYSACILWFLARLGSTYSERFLFIYWAQARISHWLAGVYPRILNTEFLASPCTMLKLCTDLVAKVDDILQMINLYHYFTGMSLTAVLFTKKPRSP